MKTLLFLLIFLPFMVKAQKPKITGSVNEKCCTAPLKFTSGNLSLADTGAIEWNDSSIYITKTTQRNHFQLQSDTIKIVMLVSDTSSVKDKPNYQDTRPVMTYGYRTRRGEFLDAYKRKIGKDVIIWIAYKTN